MFDLHSANESGKEETNKKTNTRTKRKRFKLCEEKSHASSMESKYWEIITIIIHVFEHGGKRQ